MQFSLSGPSRRSTLWRVHTPPVCMSCTRGSSSQRRCPAQCLHRRHWLSHWSRAPPPSQPAILTLKVPRQVHPAKCAACYQQLSRCRSKSGISHSNWSRFCLPRSKLCFALALSSRSCGLSSGLLSAGRRLSQRFLRRGSSSCASQTSRSCSLKC